MTLPPALEVPTPAGPLLAPAHCTTVTAQLASLGVWEPEEAEAIAALLRPGATFLDVGAHVGYHLLAAAALVGPGGRAIGIEADPDTFALLQENARRSGRPWIEVHHAAAWSEPGRLRLERDPEGNTGNSQVHALQETCQARFLQVPAARLDDLLGPGTALDLVLLDAQGAEPYALRGMRELLARSRPAIVLEFWPPGLRAAGTEPEALLALIDDLGYRAGLLGDPEPAAPPERLLAAAASTAGGFCTLVLTPREPPPVDRDAPVALSVCIPTHAGRAEELAQALDSVAGQLSNDLAGRVEVVVSSGGDDPGTEAVLAARRGLLPLRHVRAEADRGFAWHLLDAIQHAAGPWCWPFSSDDALEPGALRRVLEAIATGPEALAGLSVSFEPYDRDLRAPFPAPYGFIYPPDEARPRDYDDGAALFADVGVLLAYFPAHLVRRDAWLAACERLGGVERLSPYFPHMDVIAAMVGAGGRWRWPARRLVRDRTGNDSWTPRAFGGVPARYWSAIVRDLDAVYARALPGRDDVRRDLLARWRRGVLGNRMLLGYKAVPAHNTGDDVRLATTLLRTQWRDRGFWRATAPALALPHRLAGAVLARDAGSRAVPAPPPAPPPATDPVAGLRARVGAIRFWWHSIDLGGGVVTPGRKGDLALMESELAGMRLPDLRGRSVLDIGAWDGYFSFAAERMGAARVVALDSFVWEHDHGADPLAPPPWRLPGRRGFDLAHAALGSAVEPVHLDFSTGDLAAVGTFDVVLFLGVLYHLEDPFGALCRLRGLTDGLAVIETEAAEWPGHANVGLLELFPSDERGGDPTNWWAPSREGLLELCRAAGFSAVEVVRGPPAPEPGTRGPTRYRLLVHARP